MKTGMFKQSLALCNIFFFKRNLSQELQSDFRSKIKAAVSQLWLSLLMVGQEKMGKERLKREGDTKPDPICSSLHN